MNATDSVCSACATFRATVDLPDPVPPATPMIKGFIQPPATESFAEELAGKVDRFEGVTLSQSGIEGDATASFRLYATLDVFRDHWHGGNCRVWLHTTATRPVSYT